MSINLKLIYFVVKYASIKISEGNKMLKFFLVLSASLLIQSAAYAENMNLVSGWQMKGTEVGYSSMNSFENDCILTVWSFDTSSESWKAYSPDENLAQLINSSATIQNLYNLNKDEGFWVNAKQSCIVTKEGNISDPIVIYQTNALWPYATSFTLDMIANKTFKAQNSDSSIQTFTYDENGFVSISSGCQENNMSLDSSGVLIDSWSYSYINENNETITNIFNYENKLLATDSDIGYITVSRHYDEYNKQYYENVSSMIFASAFEIPVDMNAKLPYTIYNAWGIEDKSGQTYEADGTITHFNKDGVQDYYTDTAFTVENGKITTINDYNSTYNQSYYKNVKQIVYSIADYDILKTTYEGYNKNFQVSYNDEVNTWKTLDLNSSIETFYDIFALTDNRLFNNLYDLDNKTFTSLYTSLCSNVANTFTVSSDGKTLTNCWSDGHCAEYRIENSAIVDEYSHEYYETVKTLPYY